MGLATLDVQRFLEDHLGRPVSEVTSVGQGEWSQAFFYRDGASERVVRFGDIDEDFRRDRFAAGFASARLPIPKVEEIGRAFGGYFAISERARGKMIDDLDPAEMRRTIPAVLDLFDTLRSVDTSGTSGYGGWDTNGNGTSGSWREFLLGVADDPAGGRISGWKDRLATSSVGTTAFDRAYRQLESTVAICPEERHVIHSDLLHFNLLVEEGRISAVIDWGCGLYGDWLYDLAWFLFWQPWYPSMAGIDLIGEERRHLADLRLEVPDFAERLRCCELRIGLGELAYSAFKGYWDNVAWIAERLRALS